MPAPVALPTGLARLAEEQAGVVSRRQAVALGLPDRDLAALVRHGRWRRVHRGVYAVHTGPLPPAAGLWAAVLACGAGAAVSHRTAAEVHGLYDGRSCPVHISVPAHRRVEPPEGVRLHLARDLPSRLRQGPGLPRTSVEATVLDLVSAATRRGDVVDVVTRASQRRVTTGDRLLAAAEGRAKLRHRALLVALVADAASGVHSALERDYLVGVERAHDLPRGRRQAHAIDSDGRVRWYDVAYDEHGLLVELDGLGAHPDEARARDQWRDNAALLAGHGRTLRFGWAHVVAAPCATAGQVVVALRLGGWAGRPRACGPACGLVRVGGRRA